MMRNEVMTWANKSSVRLESTLSYASWLNRIKSIVSCLKYFVLGKSDYADHNGISKATRRYVPWRTGRLENPKIEQLEKDKTTLVARRERTKKLT